MQFQIFLIAHVCTIPAYKTTDDQALPPLLTCGVKKFVQYKTHYYPLSEQLYYPDACSSTTWGFNNPPQNWTHCGSNCCEDASNWSKYRL